MKNMDYKIFVPRGENNYVRFPNAHEILIDEIISVNIYISDDKVVYWAYFRIQDNDEYHKLLLKKNKKPKMALLIGNNPYEIHGEAEVVDVSPHKWEEKIQIRICFTVVNASDTVNNPRKEIKVSRYEILDFS